MNKTAKTAVLAAAFFGNVAAKNADTVTMSIPPRDAAKTILVTNQPQRVAQNNAVSFYSGVQNDNQQKQKLKQEKYNLNWLRIDQRMVNGNNVNFTFDATSQKDTMRADGKQYASGSGDLTNMRMRLEDNDMGSFGTNLPDVRAQISIEFNQPGISNYAKVRIIINTRYKKPEDGNAISNVKRLFAIKPEGLSETPAYDVEEIILEGDNVPVTINGDDTGNKQGIANDIKSNTQKTLKKDTFGKKSFSINYHTAVRKVIPQETDGQDGQKQLRPYFERVINPTLVYNPNN